MECGVRFCGGCNPRYDRGKAFDEIKAALSDKVNFQIAQEGVPYDLILVIGGCTNCCAAYEQFQTKRGVLKMWCENHVDHMIKAIEDMI